MYFLGILHNFVPLEYRCFAEASKEAVSISSSMFVATELLNSGVESNKKKNKNGVLNSLKTVLKEYAELPQQVIEKNAHRNSKI